LTIGIFYDINILNIDVSDFTVIPFLILIYMEHL